MFLLQIFYFNVDRNSAATFLGFLKIDLSDLPALVGRLALGSIIVILIELFKNLMYLIQTSTSGVGALANF